LYWYGSGAKPGCSGKKCLRTPRAATGNKRAGKRVEMRRQGDIPESNPGMTLGDRHCISCRWALRPVHEQEMTYI
jgi:hypothetical protein